MKFEVGILANQINNKGVCTVLDLMNLKMENFGVINFLASNNNREEEDLVL